MDMAVKVLTHLFKTLGLPFIGLTEKNMLQNGQCCYALSNYPERFF